MKGTIHHAKQPFLLLLSLLALGGCAHAVKASEAAAPPATPPPAPQLAARPSPEPQIDPLTEIDAAMKSATVFFDFDSDQLRPEGTDALQRVGRLLRIHPSVRVKIEGNCDERGTEEYNLMLGQKRAAVARKYLVALGVDERQLDAISYGAMRPANPGHSEEAWTQNRRDELHASR
jgi:peptidoglycan-associated lipoprotein